MAVKSYRDLIAWQKGMDFVALIYRVSASFPADERFGLTSQIRRASVSIPSNIAEGQARSSRDFSRFLEIATGSLAEVETQLIIAERLGFLDRDQAESCLRQADELSRILTGLIKSISAGT